MARYRAVLLVPTIVEFVHEGTVPEMCTHLGSIADGMGSTKSHHPQYVDKPYDPVVVECIAVEGKPSPVPPVIVLEMDPSTA